MPHASAWGHTEGKNSVEAVGRAPRLFHEYLFLVLSLRPLPLSRAWLTHYLHVVLGEEAFLRPGASRCRQHGSLCDPKSTFSLLPLDKQLFHFRDVIFSCLIFATVLILYCGVRLVWWIEERKLSFVFWARYSENEYVQRVGLLRIVLSSKLPYMQFTAVCENLCVCGFGQKFQRWWFPLPFLTLSEIWYNPSWARVESPPGSALHLVILLLSLNLLSFFCCHA